MKLTDLIPGVPQAKLILAGIALALFAVPTVGLFITRHTLAVTKQRLADTKTAFEKTVANYRGAYAKAVVDNLADVRAKEGDAATITENKQHDLEAQLANARAAAARYAGRMRPCGADQGSAVKAPVGETARAPSEPIGAGGDAIVPERDLEVCAANTVKARGWQDWYAELRTRYNADGTP